MMIAFIIINNDLVPLIEGLCAKILFFRFELIGSLRSHLVLFFFRTSSCRHSFFDWATPVKLCSSVFCMLINCLLHQFLGSIQERVRVPHRMHVVNELK